MPRTRSPVAKPPAARPVPFATIERQQERVRRICLALPGATEKLSHGEPTFFVAKRAFAMLSSDHHDDGRMGVVIPTADGEQNRLLEDERRYYFPPYVGKAGWIGIHLTRISDAALRRHLHAAWTLKSSTPKPTPKR